MEEPTPTPVAVTTPKAKSASGGKSKKRSKKTGTTTRVKKSSSSSKLASSKPVPPGTSATALCTGNGPTWDFGLLLACLVFLVYVFGFVASIRSLPDINPNVVPNWMKNNNNIGDDSDGDQEGGGGGGSSGGGGGIDVDPAPRGGGGDIDRRRQELDESSHANLRTTNKRKKKNKNLHYPLIPETKWPVSIRNDDSNFETILHPGDGQTTMSLPKFWSKPIHEDQLMSRELAMKIGSCNAPDEKSGNVVRGEDCPVNERTIFVMIASYRDWQCRYTVESVFNKAKYPERVRVGVVDQIVDGEDAICNVPIEPCTIKPNQALCQYKNQVDVYEMEAQLAIGPVFARHVGHRLYRGEYYYMQSDAHVTFSRHWDVDIIDQQESTGNEMAVLSTYLTDITGSLDGKGNSLRHTRPIMCNTDYEGGPQGMHLRHGSQPERDPTVHGMPQLQPYWAAGYSFSRGHFVVNVPYDLYQPMIFQGEEMSIGIRGFTIGYDYYAPERSVCFHHYAEGPNAAKRNKVKHFWENAGLYKGTGIKAMKRLLGIVGMNPEVDPSEWDHTEEKTYGIGKVRTPQKFYDTFGIDVVNKVTEHHLCQFVDTGGKMHKTFMKHLRTDGMGIDYDAFEYHFKDPQKGGRRRKRR